jgi:Fe-S cluster biogenesis protein NfuA
MNVEQTSLKQRVEEVLGVIRPRLQADGGDVQLVEVSEKGVVSVRLVGACRGCPGATMTLKVGIERILKQHIPHIKSVEAV